MPDDVPPVEPMRTEVVRDNGCAVMLLVGALAVSFVLLVAAIAGAALGLHLGGLNP